MAKKSVKSMQDSIRHQVNVNRAAAREMEAGVRQIQAGVKAFQETIQAQARENAAFVREFFGY